MSPSKPAKAIAVSSLTKNYGSFQAVKGVSFEVGKGEIVGFLGPNGAGKSTVMKILTCFMSSTSGTVEVAGHNVYTDPIAVRRVVGYQPENVPLYDEMVVFDYLMFMAKMRGVPRARRISRIDHAIDVCGLRTVVSKLIGELSKGYRQRVGLAQALVHDPEVLILDEPMSGLDPNQAVEIRDLLKEIGKTKTILFSSHILQEIEKLCDRVLIIDSGLIVADGTTAELTALLEGRRRYQVQLRLREENDSGEAKKKLEELAKRVQSMSSSEVGVSVYLLTSNNDCRAGISELAKSEGWELLQLHERVLTLEDVFRSLTGGEKGAAKGRFGPPSDRGKGTAQAAVPKKDKKADADGDEADQHASN